MRWLYMRACFGESAIVMNPAYQVLPDAVRQAFEGVPMILAWRFVRA